MPAIGLFTGVLTTSTNASALGACTQVLVQAHISNTPVGLIGTVSSQTIALSAGAMITVTTSNVSTLYASTSAGVQGELAGDAAGAVTMAPHSAPSHTKKPLAPVWQERGAFRALECLSRRKALQEASTPHVVSCRDCGNVG